LTAFFFFYSLGEKAFTGLFTAFMVGDFLTFTLPFAGL
jgi:hypothetical protein